MSRASPPVALIALVLAVTYGRAQSDASPVDDLRAAVARSLRFLEEKGVAWMRERGCVTCHQTTFLIWTHNEAARRGFSVDAHKVDDWTNWALLKALAGEGGGTKQSAETLAQLILAREPRSPLTAKPSRWTRTNDPYENVLKYLRENQTANGCWVAGGQSHNPPDIPTGWALLALDTRAKLMKVTDAAINPGTNTGPGLARLFKENDEALPKSRDRALVWLSSAPEDTAKDLTEQLVVRLLVDHAFRKEQTPKRLRELLARQNADGGWSADPKLGQGSDAYATGQSLYALSVANASADEPIKKARTWLLKTQRRDGSWLVPTTACSPPSGNAKREEATDAVYTYWGTAWAALGMLQGVPVVRR